jgi:hypothetical protein
LRLPLNTLLLQVVLAVVVVWLAEVVLVDIEQTQD